jgi:putative membrane protein
MFRKILLAAALLAPASAHAAPPAAFLRGAVQANYSEVALGRIIQRRGSTPQVRSFGAMMVRDHSRSLQQAQAIAMRLHLRIPATLAPGARREGNLLQRLRGRSFDREARRYMIEGHKKTIAVFRAQARSGDRATSAYASATIPVMQHHLAAARAIRA